MDDDALDLARRLCSRAGMIMEDVSASAVLCGKADAREIAAILGEVERAATAVGAIAKAAQSLLQR